MFAQLYSTSKELILRRPVTTSLATNVIMMSIPYFPLDISLAGHVELTCHWVTMYGLSQWETALQCNAVSHWLSPYPELSLVTNVDISWDNSSVIHANVIIFGRQDIYRTTTWLTEYSPAEHLGWQTMCILQNSAVPIWTIWWQYCKLVKYMQSF